jgi:putative NADH-flavin reductase
MMNLFLVGATGRTGGEFLQQALSVGHRITALVRDPRKLAVTHDALTVSTGSVTDGRALAAAFAAGRWDVVVNTVGADPLKPSTLVTDAARALVPLAEAAKTSRYIGITGTAQMPKSFGGILSSAILRLTPVRHGAKDHDGAFTIIRASALDWTLIGCPWIKDGPTVGRFHSSAVFPGGMKTIHPGDVALALVQEIESPSVHRGIRGIWYERGSR